MTVPTTHDVLQTALRIGDRALTEGSGGVYDHLNPATGLPQVRIPMAGPTEIDEAVDVAHAAFDEWRRWSPSDRRDALLRLGELITLHEPQFKAIAALENGSPVRSSIRLNEIARGWLNYYAGWADKLDGTVTASPIQGGEFTYTKGEPYGVIGAIITWNVPLISLCMKVVPAIAAGNTVVIKPSEFTPFTSDLFTRLVLEAGIPAGVVNNLPGSVEAGNALVANPLVQKVTFTGGPVTARKIMATCAQHLKPSVMELGGKSADLIFADADLDTAVTNTVYLGLGALSGQGCLIGSRVLVEESIYDEVVERLVATAEGLVIGEPGDPETQFGPVINSASCDRIDSIVKQARESGSGRLVTGGRRLDGYGDGAYYAPTIFADVDPASDLARSEVFGPVMTVMRFRTEEEAIELANSTEYGLAAYIHSRDVGRVHRIADELNAGSVYVNGAKTIPMHAPFGGRGESGFGAEGGRAGIEEFLRPKTVSLGGW